MKVTAHVKFYDNELFTTYRTGEEGVKAIHSLYGNGQRYLVIVFEKGTKEFYGVEYVISTEK